MNIKELLEKASEAYYSGNQLLMSDEVYDKLSAKFNYDAVGATVKGNNTLKHLYQMYSLKKYFVGEGDMPEQFRSNEYVISSQKLDGAAVAIYYVNNIFSHALTRGDGKIGQTIDPDKLRYIKNIPLTNLALNNPIVQICGEVVASKNIPNSRNYVSGALNLKDSIEDKEPMYFFAYSVQPFLSSSYLYDMQILEDMGFKTVLGTESNKFKVDGKVLRLNDNVKFQELGYTNHHPRGALAVKERKDGVVTTLLDVVWQVGKSGRVTPVAILEPVIIDGAKISRATLNNAGFIRAMELNIGDSVEVIRSGDIIPTILGKA